MPFGPVSECKRRLNEEIQIKIAYLDNNSTRSVCSRTQSVEFAGLPARQEAAPRNADLLVVLLRGAVGALARVTQGAELLEVLGGGRGQAAVRAGLDVRDDRTWVENKESSPNTNTGYQPNIRSCPNIDIPRISNLSGI